MANTFPIQALTNAGYIYDKKGTMHIAWVQFLQYAIDALANTGNGSGNTVTTTTFGLDNDGDPSAQLIADLTQKVNYLLASDNQSLAIQAVQNQQQANSVTTAQDVLDMIWLAGVDLVLTQVNAYLAALPDSAANLDCSVSWVDITGAGAATPNSALVFSNTATEMQIAGPIQSLGAAIDVQMLTLVNTDAINANVSLYWNTPSGNVPIANNILLQPGYTLGYDQNGLKVYDANGIPLRH